MLFVELEYACRPLHCTHHFGITQAAQKPRSVMTFATRVRCLRHFCAGCADSGLAALYTSRCQLSVACLLQPGPASQRLTWVRQMQTARAASCKVHAAAASRPRLPQPARGAQREPPRAPAAGEWSSCRSTGARGGAASNSGRRGGRRRAGPEARRDAREPVAVLTTCGRAGAVARS